MKLIDMHCDTLMKLLADKKASLADAPFEINLEHLKTADSLVQFFACFTDLNDYPLPKESAYEQAYETVLQMISRLSEEVGKNSAEIALAADYDQILTNYEQNKISAFLTVEEGGILNGKLERLDTLYEKGIRLITLTWNYENSLAFPNSASSEIMNRGLKPFGIEVLRRMNGLGMIIDVSHLSDGGFWDVMRFSRSPVVASHSCVRELCDQPRNMTSDMLHALGNNGGVIGLNFHGGFLSPGGTAGVNDMIRHLRFIVNAAGIDSAALGSDFDGGIFGNTDFEHIGKLPLLHEALKKAHFSETEIDKIFYKNALRVIRESVR